MNEKMPASTDRIGASAITSSQARNLGIGTTRALASARKSDLRRPMRRPEERPHRGDVRPQLVRALDPERPVAIEVAERTLIVRAALGGLQDQRQVLVGRQNADRPVDLGEAACIRLQRGPVPTLQDRQARLAGRLRGPAARS